jgi:5-methylthioadenosine/S-adenosylhomocysteine deaminase
VEFDVPLQIHIAETALEVENSRKEHNMPVVPWAKKQNILEAKVLCAHCVHIDEGEMMTLLNAGAGVAHNPTSNLKLASGVAPVRQMLDKGLKVGLGTDGPASNNDLDMFEEMRLAALLAKGISGDPTALPARQALEMATIGGARALHMEDITGSLEIGKRADIIVVDLQPLHNVPRFNRGQEAVYSQLVYVSKGSDVRHLLCNGQVLMRNGELLTVNENEVREQAQALAVKIDQFLASREGDVVRKLLALGGLSEEESFEVQVRAHLEELDSVERLLADPELRITKSSRYRQYDTYFSFDLAGQGQLRVREDIYLDQNDKPTPRSRTRLTLIGEASENVFPRSVVLSRSRYTASADQSVRFYREYLNPSATHDVEKIRRRNRFVYRDTEFAINIDRPIFPAQSGFFVEIKSRTWSERDAEKKAELIGQLLNKLGLSDNQL